MKVLAMFLPQYHEIAENNKWWGKGYTEWSAVKKAKSYSIEHKQPRVPLNNYYYDLSDPEAKPWKWHAKLAKEYKIDGFIIYHYWFRTGKQLLERPMEILLEHKEINIQYAICWANESWSRTWYGLEKELLMEQEYGDKDEWKNHFYYLLKFFKDSRYLKFKNKPIINIYHTYEIKKLQDMLELWNELAIKNGFEGLYVVSGNTGGGIDKREYLFDAYYNFEPNYSLIYKTNKIERLTYGLIVKAREFYNKIANNKIVERQIDGKDFLQRMLRDDVVHHSTIFPCVFPQWDNTPRRQYKGTVFNNMNPELFKKQIKLMLTKYPESEFLYINAWNEWGEGAYLEPDTDNEYKYLEVIKDAFDNKK